MNSNEPKPMNANIVHKLVATGSVFGAIALLGACGSSATDSEGSGGEAGSGNAPASGGAAGSGNAPASGGAAGSGDAPASGGAAGSGGSPASGGTAGLDCPEAPTPVILDGSGGGGADDILCYPGVVCFAPAVATPGFSFVRVAFAYMGASADGMPTPTNESGVMTAQVSYPEPGTVCMSGDDGAGLSLRLGAGPAWDGRNAPSRPTTDTTLHAEELGIVALRFTIETPPSTGVAPSVAAFDSCMSPTAGGDAEQDGNPVVITSNGTTTLSFATNFTPFDANALGAVRFIPGSGEYDFCVKDLQFLDANGDEVTP